SRGKSSASAAPAIVTRVPRTGRKSLLIRPHDQKGASVWNDVGKNDIGGKRCSQRARLSGCSDIGYLPQLKELSRPSLLFEKHNQIAYITFNRPEVHNSFSPETMVRLADAWQEVNRDDDIRAAILTGAGDVAFSAGADLGRLIPLFTGTRKPEDEWDEKLLANRRIGEFAVLRHYDVDKPIIAAVNGFCIAGGMELMQATDLRVASETASFGLQEVKWAIVPAAGSLVRLQRQIPYCKAMEILLTGDRIDAQEAWRLGLVNYVVPKGRAMEKAEELAATIAANGPIAGRKIKEAVRRTSGVPLEEAFRIENECARDVIRSEDAREGPRAFMEKRKPVYKGR